MDKIQQYKIKKQHSLWMNFNKIKEILETKYNIPIDFTMEYDSLTVGSIKEKIEAIREDFKKDVINYTKEILDEHYESSFKSPFFISNDPNNINPSDLRAYYKFKGLLKDNEPE